MFLLVLAYPGSPGQKAVKRLCVCGADVVICLERGADLHIYGPTDATATHCLLLQ